MFSKSARFYDAIYSWKDYEAESRQLHELIEQHRRSEGMTLLDVGCGTGGHIEHLRQHYIVEGLDLDPEMLAVAREKYPDLHFHQRDMVDFDLGHLFDVIVCLFSSIGYVCTVSRLQQAISTMQRHLKPGGVVAVEPWFAPDTFRPGTLHGQFVDEPDLKIARINLSRMEGCLSIIDFHYLVGTSEEVDHFVERHELGLFTPDEYLEAFRTSGLEVVYDDKGLMGRGLYIGVKGGA